MSIKKNIVIASVILGIISPSIVNAAGLKDANSELLSTGKQQFTTNELRESYGNIASSVTVDGVRNKPFNVLEGVTLYDNEVPHNVLNQSNMPASSHDVYWSLQIYITNDKTGQTYLQTVYSAETSQNILSKFKSFTPETAGNYAIKYSFYFGSLDGDIVNHTVTNEGTIRVKDSSESAGDVTVKYVDEDGNKLADDFVKTGNIGDTYTTEQKSIDGYTFKEVQGNATGKFTDAAQTVTYVYTKNAEPEVAGDVTAKYVDEEGNKIADDVVKTGNIGDTYTTEQKSIDGYTFKEVQGNATGKFTDAVQTVTYVYTKNAVPNPVVPNNDDQTDNKPASSNKTKAVQKQHSKHLQKAADKNLPKTHAEKAGELVGYIFVIAALVGLSVFDYKRRKQRKNKDN